MANTYVEVSPFSVMDTHLITIPGRLWQSHRGYGSRQSYWCVRFDQLFFNLTQSFPAEGVAKGRNDRPEVDVVIADCGQVCASKSISRYYLTYQPSPSRLAPARPARQ